jgi:hypothetical protein
MSTDPLSRLYKGKQIENRNIVAYGGFKEGVSGYTRNRMQNTTIKMANLPCVLGYLELFFRLSVPHYVADVPVVTELHLSRIHL